jgi:large subunit ribosomal protein L25
MEKILVKADARSEVGKGAARSLRRDGMLPAVVYSGGDSKPVKINGKEMTRLIFTGTGDHALLTIELHEDGSKKSEHSVLVKDYQVDPVSDELLHVDFIEVSLKDLVKVTVPIVIVNDPIGIKMGGILEYHVRDLEIECLPTQIPDKIEVDAAHIDIGHSLHISDIAEMEGIKIISDPKGVILNVSAPKVEEEVVEEEVEEGAEPELVGEKGKEEGKEEPAQDEKEK